MGCGTGENALHFAGLGHEVVGIDAAPAAIQQARAKAEERGLSATFLLHDALDLGSLGGSFETVIDSGLFHTFSDADRERFVESLEAVLPPGGTYFMLCFSEREPREWGGPRRIRQAEVQKAFREGWKINYIRAAVFESTFHPDGGHAWLASITRQ